MYRKEKSILLKGSSSALYNNLSVLPLPAKQLTYFATVHSSAVNMVSASADGLSFSHRQLVAKEGSLGVSTSIVTQVTGLAEGWGGKGAAPSFHMTTPQAPVPAAGGINTGRPKQAQGRSGGEQAGRPETPSSP